MVGAVVLDDEPCLWVVQVGPPDKPAGRVVEVDLDLRSGKSGFHEQPAQPGFHRGFGRLGQIVMTTETELQGRVGEHQVLDGRESLLEVAERACNCRGAQAANALHIRCGKGSVSHDKPGTRSNSRIWPYSNFGWVDGVHVEVIEPRCAESREDSVGRQASAPGDEDLPRVLSQARIAIELRSDPPPRFAAQGIQREAVCARLGERKGLLGQLPRHIWSTWHPPSVSEFMPARQRSLLRRFSIRKRNLEAPVRRFLIRNRGSGLRGRRASAEFVRRP